MGHAVTDQRAGPGEVAVINEQRKGLSRFRPHHSGVKIDQVRMATGGLGVVKDAMWVMANRAGGAASRHEMPAMASTTALRSFFKRSVQQEFVPVMAVIA